MSFNVQAALSVARKQPKMRAQVANLILKEAAKKDDFAKQISKLVHKGEEELLDVKENKGSEKKASVKVASSPGDYGTVSKQLRTQIYDFIKTRYPEEKELLESMKTYLETEVPKVWQREKKKAEILEQELMDKLESLNQDAKRKREEGWGFIKTRLWLRKERKALKKEIRTKQTRAREDANREIRALLAEYEKRHPRFVAILDEEDWYALLKHMTTAIPIATGLYASLILAAALL